jgi:hypothetical protein
MEARDCPATFQAFAAALNNQITADVNRFLRDAAIVEILQPTLMANTVKQDLIRLATDVQADNLRSVFADFQTLGQHLFQEARTVVGYGFPSRYVLLATNQVVSDLLAVSRDKQVTFAFVGYIATHSQYHASPSTPTPSVWTSGLLFGPGTIGGATQAILAQQYQHALTHYSGPSAGSYDHYFTALSGSIAASGKFSALAQGVNPGDI